MRTISGKKKKGECAPLEHAREHDARDRERAVDVDGENPVELILGCFHEVDGHRVRPTDVVHWPGTEQRVKKREAGVPRTPTSSPAHASASGAYVPSDVLEKSTVTIFVCTLGDLDAAAVVSS
jgi:hypothetical protein